MPDVSFELAARAKGYEIIAGIDEVGRGPWAGPVYAAAAILDTARLGDCGLDGLDDSKKLTASRRELLSERILANALVGIGRAEVDEIDRLNILQATFLAMRRAVAALPVQPQFALVDGNKLPGLTCPCETVVKGDARSVSIAAASIVAKVARDRLMRELAESFPGYGWETNMGYGTAAHIAGLDRLGVTPHHRKSFAPIFNRLSRESADPRYIDSNESP